MIKIISKILDVGCGYGSKVKTLEKKGKVYGIDISKKFIMFAKKHNPKSNFYVMNVQKMKFKNNYFDMVFLYDVIEHLNNVDLAFQEISRVLKTNGKIYINIPYYKSEILLSKINKNYFKQVHHKQIFTYENINSLLNKYDFKITNAYKINCLESIYWIYNFLTNKNIINQQGQIDSPDNTSNLILDYINMLFSNKNFFTKYNYSNYKEMKLKTNNIFGLNPENLFYLSKLINTLGSNFFPKTINIVCIKQNQPNNDITTLINSRNRHNTILQKITQEYTNINLLNIKKLEEEMDRVNKINEEYRVLLNNIYQSKTWKLLSIYKKSLDVIKNHIPFIFRHNINKIIFFNKKVNFYIPNNILNSWSKWNYNYKNNESLDIINFSVIAWDYRFQRPQQIAKELANKNNRIFYIKNEFIPYKNINTKFAPIKVEQKLNNIFEITLSATKNLFIYNDNPSVKDINIMFSSIKYLLYKANIAFPVAKIDHPFWAHLLELLNMPIIYDCMDNHAEFKESGLAITKLENKLINLSDLVFTSSQYLYNKVNKYKNDNVIKIPNAVDFNHFNKAYTDDLDIPDDIINIPKPIIGYYGALAEWFDTEILENIAREHKNKSIVLIGLITNNKIKVLAKKYSNIHLLGEKNYKLLPNYLKQFDICIIPFILNDLIKATHPVKIFEYLAAGKTIIATKMPEIINLKNIYFADKNNFSDYINIALKTLNNNVKNRINFASKNSWIQRVKIITKKITNTIFPKVSIVLLSYNNSELIDNTISSIFHRSFYPNFELIIVDNNSDIKTINTIKKYQNMQNIKIIFNKQNYGFSKGNNIGLKKATGEYIIILNNDVIVTPGWINRLLNHYNENVGLIGPVTNSIGNEAKINISYNPNNIKELETTSQNYTSQNWGKILELNNIAAFCWLLSKNVLKKVGYFDEIFGQGLFEDDDYCMRIKKQGYKILCAEDVFIHHYGGVSFKKVKTKKYLELFNNNKFLFEKKWNTKWKPHKYRE